MCTSPLVPASPLAAPRQAGSCPIRLLVKDQNRPAQGAGGQVAGRGALWSSRLAGVELLRKRSPRKAWLPLPHTRFQGDDPGQALGAGGRQGEGLVAGTGSRNDCDYSDPGRLSESGRGARETRRHTERPRAGRDAETQKHTGRGANPAKLHTEKQKERDRPRGTGREREADRQRETKERQNRPGAEGLAARRGPGAAWGMREPGGPTPGAAPRPPRGPTRPALDPPGSRSATHLPPVLSRL